MSNGWDRVESDVQKGPMSALFVGITGFVILSVVIGGFGVAAFVLNPIQQAAEIVNKTIDADNVIYNYEWFKLRHENVLAIDRKVIAAVMVANRFKQEAGDRKAWDREDKIEYSRLRSIAEGLAMQREDLAAEYNAKSRMVNRSIFKAGDISLPESM